jgi:hypothetical protein
MCSHNEIKTIAATFPKTLEALEALEALSGSTFFRPEYIPRKHSTKPTPSGNVPTVSDVVKYVQDNPNQKEMFARPACMSYYNICE